MRDAGVFYRKDHGSIAEESKIAIWKFLIRKDIVLHIRDHRPHSNCILCSYSGAGTTSHHSDSGGSVFFRARPVGIYPRDKRPRLIGRNGHSSNNVAFEHIPRVVLTGIDVRRICGNGIELSCMSSPELKNSSIIFLNSLWVV